MVRQLPPRFENLGKRQVKSPKVYLRDSDRLHALSGLLTQRMYENSEGSCFRGNGPGARREEGASPSWGFDRGAMKPAGRFHENLPGGGPFAGGRRWLGRYSPLRGCASLAAWPAAKNPHRRTPRSFRTGSQQAMEESPRFQIVICDLNRGATFTLMGDPFVFHRSEDNVGRRLKPSAFSAARRLTPS